MKQKTLKKTISLKGIGLHTGEETQVNLVPAPENHGIKFVRLDKDPENALAADINYVVSTDRATSISNGKTEVKTIEHILSAIYGLGLDNVRIEVTGAEIPILDGNTKSFVEEIEKAGIETQDQDKEVFEVDETVHFETGSKGTEYILKPGEDLEITTILELNRYALPDQVARLEGLSEYKNQIAPCRTFVFAHEIKSLFDKNLIKGGSLKNAIILKSGNDNFNPRELEAYLSEKDLENLENHLISNTKEVCPNELAGHKLLDLIGDLALLGKPIRGRLIARNPGHTSNVEFTKYLKQIYYKQKKLKDKPPYYPNREPIHDVEGIQKLLPHRYPFLLVDKIIELSDMKVVGIKNISFNEYYFQGHFPGNPVFPGVLQMEALAQTGGILALSNVENAEEWDTYFIKMEKVKFKHKVVPGDTLILKMELLSPIRRGIVHMQGTAYVGDKIASEGELTAQIVHSRKPVDE